MFLDGPRLIIRCRGPTTSDINKQQTVKEQSTEAVLVSCCSAMKESLEHLSIN